MSDYDVFLADCPARTTLGLVADTWSVVVVYGLGRVPSATATCAIASGGSARRC